MIKSVIPFRAGGLFGATFSPTYFHISFSIKPSDFEVFPCKIISLNFLSSKAAERRHKQMNPIGGVLSFSGCYIKALWWYRVAEKNANLTTNFYHILQGNLHWWTVSKTGGGLAGWFIDRRVCSTLHVLCFLLASRGVHGMESVFVSKQKLNNNI